LQLRCDHPIAGTVSAAATAVREEHDARRTAWHGQVAVQDHSGNRDLNRIFKITAHQSSVSLPVFLHPLASTTAYGRGGRARARDVTARAYGAAG
jgi:hypothetical protein